MCVWYIIQTNQASVDAGARAPHTRPRRPFPASDPRLNFAFIPADGASDGTGDGAAGSSERRAYPRCARLPFLRSRPSAGGGFGVERDARCYAAEESESDERRAGA